MTGGNMLYLALVLFSFLAFSGSVFYASTQTPRDRTRPAQVANEVPGAPPIARRGRHGHERLAVGRSHKAVLPSPPELPAQKCLHRRLLGFFPGHPPQNHRG